MPIGQVRRESLKGIASDRAVDAIEPALRVVHENLPLAAISQFMRDTPENQVIVLKDSRDEPRSLALRRQVDDRVTRETMRRRHAAKAEDAAPETA